MIIIHKKVKVQEWIGVIKTHQAKAMIACELLRVKQYVENNFTANLGDDS